MINPIINFLDPTSILTWLDLRTMVLDIGLEFKKRMEIYTAVFSVMLFAAMLHMIGTYFGYIEHYECFTPDYWVMSIIAGSIFGSLFV